ncbi:hypothetical protein FVEG_15072 [Fusarium verticillioides 7600]|uniref:Uncharacterized protein n=1 Tax=Gibberella moniliformis (strain M3125 / FGSC 7600) TaxID=334819 RepID=W7LMP6_GIBM7|nr:hypothetical protein FVEG_15072 [Fusarium verticillioides 7600]EWG39821.1 hypothetical protein FVEG_15072 [Fusarium verticillioides 7600]
MWDRFNCIDILYIWPQQRRWSQPAGRSCWDHDFLGHNSHQSTYTHIHVLEYGYSDPESLVLNVASLYTPFENGETVSEVWVDITQNVVGGLGFRTSKGSPAPSGSLGQFDPLGAMPLIPSLRYCVEDFFGGSVDLVGVVEVTCCRLKHKPEIVSGMLFRFAGGRQEALGEVHLNGLQQPMLLGVRGEKSCTSSSDLNPENHPGIAGHRFLEASREEILEWWWSPLQCLLVYGGRASLQLRDATVWLELAP